MHALIADPATPAGFRLADIPEPAPGPNQVLIEVGHVSVNPGEVRHLGFQPPGGVLGYDASGRVVRAAESGRGPAVGDHVTAFGAGAWARRAVFDTDSVAVLPPGFDPATAAALPLAGITALRNLRAAGVGEGTRLLITGASGGVGPLAVQLAHRFGAFVTAAVGSAARATGPAELGADVIVTSLADVAHPQDVVIDLVGGPHLVEAWTLLRPGGVLQSVGWASGEPAVFPVNSTFVPGPAKTLRSFGDASAPGADLADLVARIHDGTLTVPIGWHGSWHNFTEAADAMRDRRLHGKAVMVVD
ncbi:zinc-binding dehydrogenase [Yinghuangia sp. ASG 101]|uniref:zinc-binding dehydrogenase n=1 Tax=Yinghuangia sp. ASG 101 TaxID=2896848 RepID=UPI001E369EBD|nr:zinc-binding dehydrogenase [Yinghuangia sp. ASG 101]UGQ12796.1 zinc-binding dehydrogenase [Yinghuangia sp. ASG 101]